MLDRRTGDLHFVQCTAAGKPLDDQAVVIPAGKAHPLVDAGRILPQDMLHGTFPLHEFFPVQHCQLAQTKNAVLHREFVSRRLPDVVRDRRKGQLPIALRWSNTNRHAAEVFDQAQPQHAANRPQFRQLQRCHGLVGAEKLLEALLVEPGVEMGDQFPRQMVYSRQAFPGGVAKVGQLAAVPPAEIPPGRSHQLFDPAEVVDQPHARGRNLCVARPPTASTAGTPLVKRARCHRAGRAADRGLAGPRADANGPV